MQEQLTNISAEALWKFAESNGMLNRSFTDVVNEFLTTKELAESYEKVK